MATLDFSFTETPTGSWQTNPAQPYLYSLITADFQLVDGDTYITFSNLDAGMSVTGAPSTTEPFDSIYFNNTYANEVLIKTGSYLSYLPVWANESYVLYGDVYVSFAAAYTSGGYWAYGEVNGSSPGVILTGAGNANTAITDIQWQAIDISDNGVTAPAPFDASSFNGSDGYIWTSTIANEIYSNYQVINSNTIKVTTDFSSLDSALRNLYVRFKK